ncbi:MAG: LamG-like jellyroll fold domain-containing protein [Opitutaceae bacterium]|jgi:hypothetical protein
MKSHPVRLSSGLVLASSLSGFGASVTAVPEPARAIILGVAAIAALVVVRRRFGLAFRQVSSVGFPGLFRVSPTLPQSLVLACLVFGTASLRADFTEGLLARWTFNKPGKPLLLDDTHGIPFLAAGRSGFDRVVQANPDGSVTLAPGQFLTASELGAEKNPALQKSVTLWARLRIEPGPQQHTAFLMGLQRDPKPGDWENAAFVLVYRPQVMGAGAGLFFYGNIDPGKPMGAGANHTVVEKPGQYVSAAIIFDGVRQTMSLVVDGEVQTVKKEGARLLIPAGAFTIGHLQATGDTTVTFDEVRIYGTALSPDWIAEIEPVSSAGGTGKK